MNIPPSGSLRAFCAFAVVAAALVEYEAEAVGHPPYASLLRQSMVEAVGDQKQTSECTSWAVSSAVAMNVMRNWYTVNMDGAPEIETLSDRGYRLLDASAFHRNSGNPSSEGWHIDVALRSATSVTIPFRHDARYGVRITQGGYKRLSDKDSIRDEIHLGRPVVADFEVFSDFTGNDYVYQGQGVDAVARSFHSVLLVGYNTDEQTRSNASGGEFWECLNSWGSQWGSHGFFRMKPNVCSLGNRAYVVNNTYVCDANGRKLSQAEQNKVISDAINAIPSATNAVHKNVLFGQLDGRRLPDGDQILVTASRPESKNAGKVTINLVLPKGMWWKGALLFDKAKPGKETGVQGDGGSGFSKSYTFLRTELLRKDLVLSKAKAFGVHTNMYRIKDAFTNMQPGRTYTIAWIKD